MTAPIAITGAMGFVGRHVVDLFGRQGRAMRLLLRRMPRSSAHVRAETVVGNLEDEGALRQLAHGASAVVHLAGAIAARDQAGFFATNADGTRRLADAAAQTRVKTFIYISSLAAREPALSDYGASKRAGEDVAANRAAFDLTILRPPVVYGPGDLASLPLFAQLTRRFAMIPGSPGSRFSLLHVEDLAQAIAQALDHGPHGLQEIDDGKEGGYAWPELLAIAGESENKHITPIYLPRMLVLAASYPAAALAGLSGKAPFFSPDKVRQLYHPDWVCKASSLKVPSRIQFAEGFAATLRWYRERGWLPGLGIADRRRITRDEGELLS